MWMMGCRDGSNLNFSDPFTSRRLRPLIPKPVTSTISTVTTAITATSTSSASSSSSSPSSCFNRAYTADVFGLHNTHLENNSKRELNAQPTSSRWNPTPEQLRLLEDLYQRGTRTPTAEQIQHITAQLRRFGKIEGKNVFYWFQNHKARERQKRRRRTEAADVESLERKDSVGAGLEVEQPKNWMASPNCSINAEESVSMSRAAAAAAASRRAEWIQCDAEILMNHTSLQRHSIWPMVHPSSSSSPPLYINSTATTTTTLSNSPSQRKLVHHGGVNEEDKNRFEESQTLQLFPLRNSDDKATETPSPPGSTGYQFFEFLPLKN